MKVYLVVEYHMDHGQKDEYLVDVFERREDAERCARSLEMLVARGPDGKCVETLFAPYGDKSWETLVVAPNNDDEDVPELFTYPCDFGEYASHFVIVHEMDLL